MGLNRWVSSGKAWVPLGLVGGSIGKNIEGRREGPEGGTGVGISNCLGNHQARRGQHQGREVTQFGEG